MKALRAAIPWGFLGMLAVILAVELYARRHRDNLAGDFYFGYTLASKAIDRGEARRSPVLCFGDSLMGAGIAPTILTHRLGLKAYNFAMAASSPTVSYFMLRRALESGARPRAILLDTKWTVLDGSARDCEHVLPVVGGPREFLDLAWTLRDASYFGLLATRKSLVTYHHRFEIRADVRAMLRGEPPPKRNADLPIFTRQAVMNRGALMAAFHPAAPFSGAVDLRSPRLFPEHWECNPIKAKYVERFFALAARHGIPVFWVVLPTSPNVQARRTAIGAEAAFDRVLAALQARHPNVTVVDGRSDTYPAEVFTDATHLNWVGATIFSDDLGQALRRGLTAGDTRARRVTLPPYRYRPLDIGVEDIAQTVRIAARAKGSPR